MSIVHTKEDNNKNYRSNVLQNTLIVLQSSICHKTINNQWPTFVSQWTPRNEQIFFTAVIVISFASQSALPSTKIHRETITWNDHKHRALVCSDTLWPTFGDLAKCAESNRGSSESESIEERKSTLAWFRWCWRRYIINKFSLSFLDCPSRSEKGGTIDDRRSTIALRNSNPKSWEHLELFLAGSIGLQTDQ
jgi:hypothetical protein